MDPKAYAGVARVPFLSLPVTLVAAGAGAAAYDGYFSWVRTLVALVGLVALHVAVNVLNEVSDMRTGIDLHTVRTPFSGGSGTLPSGALSSRSALIFGLVSAAVGLAIGVWFLTSVGLVLLPIMLLGAFCVLSYNRLLTRVGLGEIAAGLGLGGLAVAGTALVQNGALGPAAIAASLPAILMTFNLLLLNEFPDEEADRAGGRRHLVILLGRRSAALVYSAAALLTPAAILTAVIIGVFPVIALAAMIPSILLVKPLLWAFKSPSETVPIPALGSNVMWNLATNLALAVTFTIAVL
ncbi:MAG: prenyltransferase [Candidatus Latescibacteria bacterium]|nr:prenyltransferase [Candidatus Latescibacterota bacterium]